jgi:hypothetical protein
VRTITDSAMLMIKELQDQVKDLHEYNEQKETEYEQKLATMAAKLKAVEIEVGDLRRGIALLIKQIRELGQEPVYKNGKGEKTDA